jgi:hypothetical protein
MKYELNMDRYDYKEIKDLGLSLTFTNSELMSFTCKRKYAYNYVECLESDRFSQALFHGVSWHYFCELTLLKIKETDEIPNKNEIEDIIENEVSIFLRSELLKFSKIDKEEIFEETINNIRLGSIGWINKWSKDIHPRYKVLDAEKVLVKPILTKEDKILTCHLPIIKEVFGSTKIARLPSVGEVHSFNRFNVKLGDHFSDDSVNTSSSIEELPVFKVGKIDCVLLERETKAIWILDHKTSRSTLAYAKKMSFDLQLQSYCALLRFNLNHGMYSEHGEVFVGGMIWDITCSKFNNPSYNKDGSLKKVKRGYITHSLAIEILSNPIYESSRSDYDDYLQVLKDRDQSNFMIIEEVSTDKELDRVDAEDLIRCLEAIEFKKKCYSLDSSDALDTNCLMVRQPICQLYNFCEFSNICTQNSTFADPNMITYDRRHKLYWKILA